METGAAGDVESVVWSAITNVNLYAKFLWLRLIEEIKSVEEEGRKEKEDVLTKRDW